MSGLDGSVQVQPDSTGKKVDTSELTRDDATVVERQRAAIADSTNPLPSGIAEVRDQKLQVEDRALHALERIEALLQEIKVLLVATFQD